MIDQAENLRKIIHGNNQFKNEVSKARSARVITITSGKGGVGKSNVAVNLAVQLRKIGKKVVIIDADFGLANIEVILGIVPQYTISDVMNGKKVITDVMTEGPLNIKFISGGSGVQDLIRLNESQLSYFIKNLYLLDKMADFILIDTGAGLTDPVLSFSRAADEIILVTTPEPTSITDAYALVKTLSIQNSKSIPNIKLLVNRVDDEEEGKEIYLKLKQVSKRFLGIEIEELGYIPYDRALVKSVKLQEPVSISFPKSEVSRAFEDVSNKIANIDSVDKTGSGFTSFVKRLMNIFNS
ncbi:MAG: flagellar biosynthesis protein FlhG [Epulopiscium sp.]|jgi:flagellar biosynthesis protein FlhG|uniref:MinD/ParA family protein n=1 Tax=Defluviitalea raffinosedens TaxID=1450156 RepID=UPI001764130E|nr:MinD/ParA family protein [Defluviitalea raffinosedens]MBM7685187.1 flagellar biosynthesis protein FlhG [Defluviitalea raffinosedens]MDK2787167.1 flagellar biosynthesis protein FlhG [Candidatus Epulonipiscium sp.]HHW67374.1 MinD/ParA family protein [Candidatus Epulonipiscium sp.]